jgi:nucleoside-diphosphate-sugar epimerase
MKIAVLGASGKSGALVVARLCEAGHQVTVISRDPAGLQGLDTRIQVSQGDLNDVVAMTAVLASAVRVISVAHAKFTKDLLAALPGDCSVVLTGSVRKYTRLVDPAADDVRAGEAAFLDWLANGGAGVMVHPSMIYGAVGDRNIGRILGLIRRWPRILPLVLPLPGGGRNTVQPIFADDFSDAIVAAATATDPLPSRIDIVGPVAIPYATMVRECAGALGRRAFILPVPVWAFVVLSKIVRLVGIHLPFTAQEFARGAEDKRFDPAPMIKSLGVTPRSFAQGVRDKIAREG